MNAEIQFFSAEEEADYVAERKAILAMQKECGKLKSEVEQLRKVIIDMKMSATNALAEAWLDPRPSKEEAYYFLVEALKIIQARGSKGFLP